MALATEEIRVGPEWDQHLELVRRFPLRPLLSDEEPARAIEFVDSPSIRGDLEPGERDYLDVLTDLVEKCEADVHPMPPVTDAVLLRRLMEARGINQSKLLADVGISVPTICEVLGGKRRLVRRHIRILAKYFNVSPAAFAIQGIRSRVEGDKFPEPGPSREQTFERAAVDSTEARHEKLG